MGCSSASAGTDSKVGREAEHRKRAWDGEFSAVRSQTNVVACLHLNKADCEHVPLLANDKYKNK